ncbi:MAG: hypothetical protein ACPG06_10305, partial [Alphaproteobacteria bacterium]
MAGKVAGRTAGRQSARPSSNKGNQARTLLPESWRRFGRDRAVEAVGFLLFAIGVALGKHNVSASTTQ